MTTLNDKTFVEKLNLCVEYLNTFCKFPVTSTEINGFKIGQWLSNQITFYRKGTLSDYRVVWLNTWLPGWNLGKEARNNIIDQTVAKGKWKINVPSGKHPVDILYSGEKLTYLVRKGIYDLETLLEKITSGDEKDESVDMIYGIIYPWVDPRYIKLITAITCIRDDELPVFLKCLLSTSADEMNAKFEYIFSTLRGRESAVLTFRFLQHKSLQETGKELNIHQSRVSQIEARALRRLRNPRIFNDVFFYGTGTILDSEVLSALTRASLYRLGITTEDKFLEAINSNILSDEVKEQMKVALELFKPALTEDDIRDGEIKVDLSLVTINYLNLSARPYNCLLKAGINNCQELIDIIEEDSYRILNVRNLGRVSLIEILDKVDERLPRRTNTARVRELL